VGEVAKGYDRIQTGLAVARQLTGNIAGTPDAEYIERFGAAMDDDFNTAEAIGVVFEALTELNKLLSAGEQTTRVADLGATLTTLLGYLGVGEEFENAVVAEDDLTSSLIEKAIEWRKAARATKQYALSDQIRDDLKSVGIIIEDRPQGTTWRKA
jgi:cysteinyl-tRNA synthetase